MNDVTRVLSAIDRGDPAAAEQLLPLVYHELRKLAAFRLAQEKPGQTLQATALVHEAYLRLVGPSASGGREPKASGGRQSSEAESQQWDSRGHFFAAAAEAMRRILIERARSKATLKRAGDRHRLNIDELTVSADERSSELLALDEALTLLQQHDLQAANLVKLRFFAGLNMSQTAEALGISVRSAHDLWAYARSWLHQKLGAE